MVPFSYRPIADHERSSVLVHLEQVFQRVDLFVKLHDLREQGRRGAIVVTLGDNVLHDAVVFSLEAVLNNFPLPPLKQAIENSDPDQGLCVILVRGKDISILTVMNYSLF